MTRHPRRAGEVLAAGLVLAVLAGPAAGAMKYQFVDLGMGPAGSVGACALVAWNGLPGGYVKTLSGESFATIWSGTAQSAVDVTPSGFNQAPAATVLR